MERDDSGVIELRRQPCLAQEPGAGFRDRVGISVQYLERDVAVQGDVAREIHGAHPATSQVTHDLVLVGELTVDERALFINDDVRPCAFEHFERADGHASACRKDRATARETLSVYMATDYLLDNAAQKRLPVRNWDVTSRLWDAALPIRNPAASVS